MKLSRGIIGCLLVSCFALGLSACSSKEKGNSENSQQNSAKLPEVKDEVKIIDGIQYDYENAFFDDFTNGVNYDDWLISEDCWGSNKGGITVKNLFYTDEGTLLMRATGNYYSGNEIKGYGMVKDGKCTGAALVSKFVTGPGRYQIKMIPHPRLGACTAFWTYCNRPAADEDNDNHEIDIELPGGKSSNIHTFRNCMNTNYITEKFMTSKDYVLSEVTNGKTLTLNDGKFHTFGFDWYTDPEIIVYYIDGVVTHVAKSYIPYLQTRIWFGVWISYSDAFMGKPNYESDFMEVDWVKYIPFKNQPCTKTDVDIVSQSIPKEEYPTSPSSKPVINKIANGDFEYLIRKNKIEDYGWNFSTYTDASAEEKLDPVGTKVSYVSKTKGKDGSAGGVVNKRGILKAVIDSAYDGYTYDFSFDAKSTGEDSICKISFFEDPTPGSIALSSITLNLDQGDWKTYTRQIVVPEGTSSFDIRFSNKVKNSETQLCIDNVNLVRTGI